MRICFFIGEFYSGGGIQRAVQMLANQLSENNNIFIISKDYNHKSTYYKLNNNIIIDYFPKRIKTKFYIIKDIFFLNKYTQKNKIETIIVADTSLAVFSLPLKILNPKLRQIYWEHFCVLNNNRNPRMECLRKNALKFGDIFVTLTKDDANYLEKKYKKGEKIRVIPNIATYEEQNNHYNSNSKTIITVGNMLPEKGFDLAILAAKDVFNKHSDWNWEFYGDGSMFNELKRMIIENNLEKNIILRGRHSDLSEAYKKASFYVLPSRSEGFGLVIIEAKAFHLPVIAFDVAYGPRNLIDNGIDGILVPPENTKALGEAICLMIENKEYRLKLSCNSSRNLKKYLPTTIVNQWKQILF